jgi:hypothetical protein
MLRYIVAVLISILCFVSSECPPNGGAALQPKADLLSCSAATLRKFYDEDDCCIVNLAECNNIERAWELSRNVINWKPLCSMQESAQLILRRLNA